MVMLFCAYWSVVGKSLAIAYDMVYASGSAVV